MHWWCDFLLKWCNMYFIFSIVYWWNRHVCNCHCNDVLMSAIASQITSLAIVNSNVYSGADQRKHQSSASLAFVWGIHRWPVRIISCALVISSVLNSYMLSRERAYSNYWCIISITCRYHITGAWYFHQRWQLHNTPGDWFTFPV